MSTLLHTLPLASSSPRALWYLTRGAGAVTLVMLTASVTIGILDALRFKAQPYWPRFAIDRLHRNISLLSLVFLTLHVATAILDSFAHIALTAAVIPFISSYRPIWLGLGTLALDLMLALAITSLLRARLGFKAWRAIHWLAYACWPIALVHGLGTGTDSKSLWMLILSAVCVLTVLIAITWRAASGWPEQLGLRSTALVGSAAGLVALIAWLAAGPLAPGWARRAGTPASVIASTGGGSTSAGSGVPVSAAALKPPFSAKLNGTETQATRDGGATAVVNVNAALTGGAEGTLSITLTGEPLSNGGVSMTSSTVTLGPRSQPHQYEGRIVSLDGDRLNATVTDGSGTRVRLLIDLSIDSSGNLTGTLSERGE